MKCNDDPIIIQTLALLGIGFDCASKGEISKIMSYDIDAESVIFAKPTQKKWMSKLWPLIVTPKLRKLTHITQQRSEKHDSWMWFFELKKITVPSSLVLRIRCDAKVCLSSFGEKYGCDPNAEAENLIKMAKTFGLNVCKTKTEFLS